MPLITHAGTSGSARKHVSTDPKKGLPDRLRQAFDGATNAEVARRIDAVSGTVKPYFDGLRIPAPEILLKIARATGVNIHWLLTGEGSRRVETRNTFSEIEEAKIQEFARENDLTFDQAVHKLTIASLDMLDRFQD